MPETGEEDEPVKGTVETVDVVPSQIASTANAALNGTRRRNVSERQP